MKRGLALVSLSLILVLSVSLVSAGWFSDFFGNVFDRDFITGLATNEGPDTPTGISAKTLSESEIEVSWNSVDSAVRYQVATCRNSSSCDSPNIYSMVYSPNTSYIDDNLDPDSTHSYKVRAIDENIQLSDWSEDVSITVGKEESSNETEEVEEEILSPTGVSAESLSDSEIRVTWDSVEGADLYRVAGWMNKKSCDGSANFFSTVWSPDTSYLDDSLEPGSTHSYKIQARVDGVLSNYSSCVTATAREPINDTEVIEEQGISISISLIKDAFGVGEQIRLR